MRGVEVGKSCDRLPSKQVLIAFTYPRHIETALIAGTYTFEKGGGEKME